MNVGPANKERTSARGDLLDACLLGGLVATMIGLAEIAVAGHLAGIGLFGSELRSIGRILILHFCFGIVSGLAAVVVSRFAVGIGLLRGPRPVAFSLAVGWAAFLPTLALTPPSWSGSWRLSVATLASVFVVAAIVSWAIRTARVFPRNAMLGTSGALLILLLLTQFDGRRFRDTANDTAPRAPNVILISLDTVRPDHLEMYGYTRPTSPNLAELARDSVVFDAAFASEPWTLPSHMSMMTSLYPLAHGVLSKDTRLNEEVTTLAEVLGETGYTSTAFVAGSEESWTGGRRGFADGFDHYYHPPHQLRKTRGTSLLWFFHTLWGPAAGSVRDINASAIEFLRSEQPQPAFLFLHYYDAHSDFTQLPYDAPESMIRMFLPEGSPALAACDDAGRCASNFLATRDRASMSEETLSSIIGLYDAGIRYLDAELGKLFDALKELDYYDESIIIVTSDHGEELFEHGRFLHTQVYDEVLQVPLIIKLPKGEHAGHRVRNLVEHVDLMPTVLDLLRIPHEGEMQGSSLANGLEGDEMESQYVFFSNTDQGGDFVTREIGMRTPDRKLIIGFEHTRAEGPEETHLRFFDLDVDPEERNNLAGDELPAEADWMRDALWQWYRQTQLLNQRFPAEVSVELSEAEIERLRALGYLR